MNKNTQKYKVCYKCRKKLPLTIEYFAKQKKSSDGFDGRCKSCVNLISREYRKERGEKYRVDNLTKKKEQQQKRIEKGQCRHCSAKRLKNSNLYCEKHWFQYVSKNHLGTMKRWKEVKILLEEQNYKCAYTGLFLTPAVDASVDHIIALSTDAEQYNKIENLQWVHSDINRMKNNHTEEDFLKYIKLIYESRLSG